MSTQPATTSAQCAHCHASDKEFRILLCGDCRLLGYCSKQCQYSDWKFHKPTCKASQADSPSTSSDPIAKLNERINAARFQQSRPRQFSTFITPQDVISVAEKSYKDSMRDAETLLRCEPEYRDEFVGDEKWIDERWEWVDLCEKILGKGQAALQTLNIFQKKLEVPPILIGSDGSFVGQSKKTVRELSDKYGGESLDNLQTLDSNTSVTDDGLSLCSRCRTRGTVCDGKKGRACAPCKKSKLSCNLSSTRITAAKSKDGLRNSAGTSSVVHPTRSRTSERSLTPTQRKLESWVESLSPSDAVLNNPTARPSKPKSMSAPVICNSAVVKEESSRTLKRERSSDSLDTQNPLLWTESNNSSSKDHPTVNTITQQPLRPNDTPCARCKTTGKKCVGLVGRPCAQCKKLKLGCSLSGPKKVYTATASVSLSASASTSASASALATTSTFVPTSASAPITASLSKSKPCERCKAENRSCMDSDNPACIHYKKSKTNSTTIPELGLKPDFASLTMPLKPSLFPSTPLPPLPPLKTRQILGAPTRTTVISPKLYSSSIGKPVVFDFQAEFSEPCYSCKETGAACWGLKDFDSASGQPKPGSSCWRCLESNKMCSKRMSQARAAVLSSNPESDRLPMASEPSLPREMMRRPFIGPHPPTVAGPNRNPARPFDPHKQVGSAPSSYSPRPDARTQSSHKVITDSKLPTLHGPKSPKRAQGVPTGEMFLRHASLGRCDKCDMSGGPCSGPEGCGTCKTLRVTSSHVGTSLPQGSTAQLEPNEGRLSAVDMSRTRAPLTAPLIKVDRSQPPDFEQSNKQRKVDDVEAKGHQVQGTILESDKPPHSAHTRSLPLSPVPPMA